MSIVEETLRVQRAVLRETARRTLKLARPPRHERLVLFGLGSSHHVARLVAADLGGLACQPQEVGVEVVPAKADLAVAFSHRAKNVLTLEALKRFRQAGAQAVLISAEGTGGDIVSGPAERCEPHTIALTSAACAAETWLLGRDVWKPVYEAADAAASASKPPTILLGEHAAYWVAREAALKFAEMAHLTPRVYGSEEYFHGPSWIAAPQDRVWHVLGPGDPRAGEVQAERVFEVRPGPAGWAEALLALQRLALETALARGVDPDDPRRASTTRASS